MHDVVRSLRDARRVRSERTPSSGTRQQIQRLGSPGCTEPLLAPPVELRTTNPSTARRRRSCGTEPFAGDRDLLVAESAWDTFTGSSEVLCMTEAVPLSSSTRRQDTCWLIQVGAHRDSIVLQADASTRWLMMTGRPAHVTRRHHTWQRDHEASAEGPASTLLTLDPPRGAPGRA